jgi:hypothetical protein
MFHFGNSGGGGAWKPAVSSFAGQQSAPVTSLQFPVLGGGGWTDVPIAANSVATTVNPAQSGSAFIGGSGTPINSSGPPRGGARQKRLTSGEDARGVESPESPAKKTHKSKPMKTVR